MTFQQIIEQTQIERAKVATQLDNLDAALAALNKIATAPAVPQAKTRRTWTPEQKARLSASLKRVFAAKKAAHKPILKAKG